MWWDIQDVAWTECIRSCRAEIFCRRGWLIEVSPYIHPPFKGVMSRHCWWYCLKRDSVEVCESDVTRGSRVFLMKIHDALRHVNIVCWFPGVMFNSVSFPLDKVAQFPVNDSAIEDFLHNKFLFSVNDFQKQRGMKASTWYWSSGTKVNLTTLKTGWRLLIEGRGWRWYALFLTFLITRKGPSLWWESFWEGLVVRGHRRAPTSPTEYVCLTTPEKLCLADTPYIPPHRWWPHHSSPIVSLSRPLLTNQAQPWT